MMLFPAGMENRIEEIAEAILQKIAEAGIANEHSVVQPNLTISQGYACFVPEGTESGARLIEHADKALYYVKRNSRNAYYIIQRMMHILQLTTCFDKFSCVGISIISKQRVLSQEGLKWKN